MCFYLLLGEFALDFIVVTRTEHDGFGQLALDSREPRAKVAHVLIELLHHHQGLLQLPHPVTSHTHTQHTLSPVTAVMTLFLFLD